MIHTVRRRKTQKKDPPHLDAGKQKDYSPEEHVMIHNIFEFDDISAEEIMTPVQGFHALMEESDIWEQTIYESRHRFTGLFRQSR